MYKNFLTNVKQKYKKITCNVNDVRTQRTDADESPIILQSVPDEVIALKNYFEENFSDKKITEEVSLEKSPSVVSENENLYIKFVKYIMKNREGENLPPRSEIDKFLGIGSTKRKELSKRALEDGFLIKNKSNDYILNSDRNTINLDFTKFEDYE